jgi:phosphocarrier protein HPr
MSEKRASGYVLMTNAVGLHARPSVKLTKLAKTFGSRVELAFAEDGPWIDAKSIVKVMAAKAARDTLLQFRAEGADADLAVNALIALVKRDFDLPAGEPGDLAHAEAG